MGRSVLYTRRVLLRDEVWLSPSPGPLAVQVGSRPQSAQKPTKQEPRSAPALPWTELPAEVLPGAELLDLAPPNSVRLTNRSSASCQARRPILQSSSALVARATASWRCQIGGASVAQRPGVYAQVWAQRGGDSSPGPGKAARASVHGPLARLWRRRASPRAAEGPGGWAPPWVPRP